MTSSSYDVGRGQTAVTDMKRRIAALKASGADVIDALWERSRTAELGEGYQYEYATEEHPHPVRPDGHRGQ
jgi:hypothetical protein